MHAPQNPGQELVAREGTAGTGSRLLGEGARLPVTLVLGLVYFACAKLGLHYALLNPSASVIWPPTGLSIAAFLVLGRAVWPGIFAGAWLANATTAGTALTALGIACGNTLEGLVGAALVARFARGRRSLERPGDVFRFAFLAGVISPVLSASVGVASLMAGGFVARASAPGVWITWWLGDAVGAWLVAPLLLGWSTPSSLAWDRRKALEVGLLALCLAGTAVLVTSFRPRGESLKFLCLPPLLWVAFRFSPREVASAMVLVAAVVIARTIGREGALDRERANSELQLVQAFLGVLSISSLAVCAAVAEIRRVEADLRQHGSRLRRSNDELEQFAAVASHDLQEPLRMVSSYLQLFERRCRTPLEPEARDCLGQARAGAERMRELLEGLLAYSRLDARSSLGRADCGLALRSALDNLRIAILDEGAAIETRGDLPVVRGDEHQLAQLFQNLIGNALKFHRPGVPPRIEIEAETRDGAWLFAVRDDGIGIDPRAAERVFLMFQRLHHREEYAGTGVGLAISKKIVERHGGRIWVEPRAGPGCSFLFTLPATWPAT